MNKETFGLIVMMTMAIGSLVIGWEIQRIDFILGYTVGVFGLIFSVGVGLNIMTWGNK